MPRRATSLSLLSAVAVAGVAAGVLELDEASFKARVGGDKPAFVKFYAPWCGHCKAMAPDWETLSNTFQASDPIVIAKVNADDHRELASKYGVSGYPTLKWFPANSDKPEDYSGGRTAEDLIEYVNSRVGTSRKLKTTPSAVPELTSATFDAIVGDSSKHRLVEFYASWCGHCKHLAPVYEKVGAAFDGESRVLIAKVDADKHRDIGERFGIKGFPTIKYFPAKEGALEDIAEDYSSGRDEQSFIDFMNEKAGTFRASGGGVTEKAGRLDEFDELAKEFLAASDKAAKLAEAREVAAGLSGEQKASADLYLKAMAKIIEVGAGWPAKEAARLSGLIASESTAKAKKVDFSVRRNVVKAFEA